MSDRLLRQMIVVELLVAVDRGLQMERTILVLAVGALTVPTIVHADSTPGASRPLAKLTSTTDSPATGRWVKVQAWCSGKTHEPLQVSGAPVWIERHDLASANAATASWSKFPLRLTQAAAPASGFTQTFTRSHLDALEASNQAVVDVPPVQTHT